MEKIGDELWTAEQRELTGPSAPQGVPQAPVQPAPLTDSQEEPSGQGWRLVREMLETIVLTVVIFLVVNTVTGRFRIEGQSMEPNLHDGQYLVINKLSYKFHPPQRGDVVVFHYPKDPSRDFIKRVIGLPGERVEIRAGRVFINGRPLYEPYIASPATYSGSWTLGPGEYFVLGDNRRNSSDSHNGWLLPRDQIVGKAWLSYWPPSHWGLVMHYRFSADVQSPVAPEGRTK